MWSIWGLRPGKYSPVLQSLISYILIVSLFHWLTKTDEFSPRYQQFSFGRDLLFSLKEQDCPCLFYFFQTTAEERISHLEPENQRCVSSRNQHYDEGNEGIPRLRGGGVCAELAGRAWMGGRSSSMQSWSLGRRCPRLACLAYTTKANNPETALRQPLLHAIWGV